jgi:hypothetical protein
VALLVIMWWRRQHSVTSLFKANPDAYLIKYFLFIMILEDTRQHLVNATEVITHYELPFSFMQRTYCIFLVHFM